VVCERSSFVWLSGPESLRRPWSSVQYTIKTRHCSCLTPRCLQTNSGDGVKKMEVMLVRQSKVREALLAL
jgi:hypothetical protein